MMDLLDRWLLIKSRLRLIGNNDKMELAEKVIQNLQILEELTDSTEKALEAIMRKGEEK